MNIKIRLIPKYLLNTKYVLITNKLLIIVFIKYKTFKIRLLIMTYLLITIYNLLINFKIVTKIVAYLLKSIYKLLSIY